MINFCYTNIPIKLYKEKVDMGFTSVLHFDPIKQEDETYLCVECVPNYLEIIEYIRQLLSQLVLDVQDGVFLLIIL